VRSYAWDARNQLASLTGPVNASFGYDAFGRRRAKTVGSTTTNFLYDFANPIQELSGASPTATLLTGLGIDEYFTRTDAGGERDYVADVLGSSIALTDGSGTVQTEYTYEAFGATMASGGSTSNAFGFTGRETDGTGLLFYRARYYDPRLQRFISHDPLGVAAGDPNTAAFVANEPTMLRDPSGMLFMPIPPRCLPHSGKSPSFWVSLTCGSRYDIPILPIPLAGVGGAGAAAAAAGRAAAAEGAAAAEAAAAKAAAEGLPKLAAHAQKMMAAVEELEGLLEDLANAAGKARRTNH
jgi:RHS repeat-associated protein